MEFKFTITNITITRGYTYIINLVFAASWEGEAESCGLIKLFCKDSGAEGGCSLLIIHWQRAPLAALVSGRRRRRRSVPRIALRSRYLH